MNVFFPSINILGHLSIGAVWVTIFIDHASHYSPLQWCHNKHNGISNHWPLNCLLNCMFRYRSKNTSSLSLAFVRVIHQSPVNSVHKWPIMRQMFLFDDFIMQHPFAYLPGKYLPWPHLTQMLWERFQLTLHVKMKTTSCKSKGFGCLFSHNSHGFWYISSDGQLWYISISTMFITGSLMPFDCNSLHC